MGTFICECECVVKIKAVSLDEAEDKAIMCLEGYSSCEVEDCRCDCEQE